MRICVVCLIRLVWLESCSNPTLQTVDVAKMSSAIKSSNPDAIFAVDNTVLSPYIMVSVCC